MFTSCRMKQPRRWRHYATATAAAAGCCWRCHCTAVMTRCYSVTRQDPSGPTMTTAQWRPACLEWSRQTASSPRVSKSREIVGRWLPRRDWSKWRQLARLSCGCGSSEVCRAADINPAPRNHRPNITASALPWLHTVHDNRHKPSWYKFSPQYHSHDTVAPVDSALN